MAIAPCVSSAGSINEDYKGGSRSDFSESDFSYPTTRSFSQGESTPEDSYKNFDEKISILVDSVASFYKKIGEIEDRLKSIEDQNTEILLLLGKDDDGSMRFIEPDFVDISADQMKEQILEYYNSHKIVYPSDIAFECNFDLKEVVRIIDDLIKEGKVKEVS